MGLRPITFAEHEFYHVYNRGVDKRDIYLNHTDYERFSELLYLSNCSDAINVRDIKRQFDSVYQYERSAPLVAIGAYCLMPNHYHLLLTPLQEGGVSNFLNKLGTSYSMYFNKRYERTGSLFQGRFKAQHADTDEYLKYLYAYIHLNPVKLKDSLWREHGIQDTEETWQFLRTYQYSSLPFYLSGFGAGGSIVSADQFPEYFLTAAQHQAELLEWLSFNDLP